MSPLYSCTDPDPGESELCLTPGSRAATAGFRGTVMRVVWKSSRRTVEASTPCSTHPDFERTLYGSPITCDPRSTTITGPLPTVANAIWESSNTVCGP